MTQHDHARVLDFWLGDRDAEGFSPDSAVARWWKKDPEFDQEISTRFAEDHAALSAGGYEHWLETPGGLLASVIVLDQFSRNMFRNEPGMYATDALALRLCESGIERGWDRELGGSARSFLYMPFMHAEDVAAQERCVALFSAFRDEQPDGKRRDDLSRNVAFAEQHRDIVARFGRFPHRNAILGRTSTHEEEVFLLEDGSSF